MSDEQKFVDHAKPVTVRFTSDEAEFINENYEHISDTPERISYRDFFISAVQKSVSRLTPMDNDFFKHIEQPTTQVSLDTAPADTFTLSAADFDRDVMAPTPMEHPDAEPEPEKVPIDAEFTTQFIIDFFDGTQEPLFYYMNQSRRKKKYFGTNDDYLEAIDLSYKTDDELKELYPDDYQAKHTLVAKLKEFNARMTKIKKDLPFTGDEREQLERPLKKLVEKSNLDIPPGLAMVMIATKILSTRFLDVYAD